MQTLKAGIFGMALLFLLTFAGCKTTVAIRAVDAENVLDYVAVYDKNGQNYFLDNVAGDETFDRAKETYDYTTTDSAIVIRVNLTAAALIDFDHDYTSVINNAVQADSYTLRAGLNTFIIKVMDASEELVRYTIHITRTPSPE
jgi:hypothetical protein